MNYKMIAYVLGWILLFEGGFLAAPTVTAIVYGERIAFWSFFATMLICLAIGHIIIRNKPQKTVLLARDGFVTVAFSWIVLSLFGSIPFMLTGVTESFIDAFFETVSGFTTTGATIFADVEILPRSIITWRSFTHWIGGMGVLVFIMAFLPLSGANNMNIMKAESPGPEVSKLVPKIRSTAIWLYGVYIGLTLVQFVLLLFGDMNVFEAFNTALSTAGTGGFGFRNDSLASFSSYTQIVVAIFMLLFSINFGSYFLILRGKLKGVLTSEIELFVLIVMGAVVCIAFNNADMFSSYSESFKHSFFSVASIISTTGFMSIDFDLWHEFSKSVIVILMLIGACAGSTGGGIKVSRIIIIFKVMGRELSTALRPKQVKKITIDGQVQDLSVVKAVYGYIFCFIAVFVISVLLISFEGYDLVTNFTSVAATVGNVGPGLEKVGPVMNYGFFSPFSKLVLCFDMLAGRLEFYPILLLFVPSTWRK